MNKSEKPFVLLWLGIDSDVICGGRELSYARRPKVDPMPLMKVTATSANIASEIATTIIGFPFGSGFECNRSVGDGG